MKVVFKDLKANCVELNKSSLLKKKIKIIGVKKDIVLTNFIDEIDDLIDNNKGDEVPESVYSYYQTLDESNRMEVVSEKVGKEIVDDFIENKEEKNKEEKPIEKKNVKSIEIENKKEVEKEIEKVFEDYVVNVDTDEDCPVFGEEFDIKNNDCIQCNTHFPNDYKECKKIFEKNTKKTEKKVTKVKEKTQKNIYNHGIEKQPGKIDEFMINGAKFIEIIEMFMDEFNIKKSTAKSRIISHYKHLVKSHSVTLVDNIILSGKIDEKTQIKIDGGEIK